MTEQHWIAIRVVSDLTGWHPQHVRRLAREGQLRHRPSKQVRRDGRPEREYALSSLPVEAQRWTECYMDAFLKKKGIRGIDLYSARCGVLHTGMAPSSLVDSGDARELWYQFRGESHVNLIVNLPQPPVLLDVDEMVSAFYSGVEQFLQQRANDPAMGKRAEEKANRFFRPGLLAGPVR